MSSYKVVSPSSEGQLIEQLENMAKNHDHVSEVRVDDASSAIQLKLDGKAHFFGYPDVAIPVRKDKLNQAKEIVSRLERTIKSGTPPTREEAHALYETLAH